MFVKGLTPILNVSDMQQSFAWFESWGWKKGWDWGDPPTFGGVCSGDVEVFLCLDAQGGRGKGTQTSTFGEKAEKTQTRGCGCRSGWRMLMPCIDIVSSRVSRFSGSRPTCPGTCAKCTSATPTDTSFASAAGSNTMEERWLTSARTSRDKPPAVEFAHPRRRSP